MDLDKLKAGDDNAWMDAGSELIPFAERAVHSQCPDLSSDEVSSVAVGALLEIIDSIESIRSERDLRGRLFSCASKRAIDKMREKNRQWNFVARAGSLDVEKGLGHDLVDTQTRSPSKALDHEELRSIVVEILEKLDPPDPEVLSDYYLDGLSQREIGEKYGWETGSVGNRLNQTLKRARKKVSSDKRIAAFFSVS